MTVTKCTWLVISVIYVGFFSWYTSFKGPLSQQEIDHYLGKLTATPRNLPVFAGLWRMMTGMILS